MAFTYVTVTHTFETANDVAASGTVDFKPVAPMHNGTTTTPATTVTATLSGAGALSQKLAANTDPGTSPTGTTYQVVERLTGQAALTYYIQVPHNQGSTLSLSDLAGWQTAITDTVNVGTGAPTIAGAVGDFYLRTDTPSTSLQRIYVCTAAGGAGVATWTGIL